MVKLFWQQQSLSAPQTEPDFQSPTDLISMSLGSIKMDHDHHLSLKYFMISLLTLKSHFSKCE